MANILGTSAEYLIGQTDNPAPIGFWINASTEPELFSLLETYHTSDMQEKERLLAYLSRLNK